MNLLIIALAAVGDHRIEVTTGAATASTTAKLDAKGTSVTVRLP